MTRDGPPSGAAPRLSPRRGPLSSSGGGGGGGGGGGSPPPQQQPPPLLPPQLPPPPSQLPHEDHRREVESLRAELEAERLRSQEARRHFALEARELRQAAERERQLLADQLRSKWEQQRARERHQLREAALRQREAEIRQLLRWKEAELREAQELLQRERDAAMRQARDLQRQLAEELVNRGKGGGGGPGLSCEGRAKLQEVLGKLRWEVDGEQAARIRHLKAELELERSLFLKYILQRFRGDPSEGPQRARTPCGNQRAAKSRPRSLESALVARCAAAASTSGGLDGDARACESPQEKALPQGESRTEPQQGGSRKEPPKEPQKALEKEKPLEEEAEQETSGVVPPDGKVRALESAEGAREQLQEPQAQECLPDSSYNQLVKQNEDLMKALVGLEERCTHLKEENIVLRKSSFPEMQDKVKRLKRKNAELTSIAKRLEERAKKLQESSLKVGSSQIPLALTCSNLDLYKTSFAQQRAKDLREQASVLLAKDQQLDALQRECWELHAKLSTGKESTYLLNICDFDRLLRESQKEVLRLQRQIMLKNLRESLQHSEESSNCMSSSVNVRETPLDANLQETSLPNETSKALNALIENEESLALQAGNGTKNTGNSLLKIDSDSEHHLEELKEQLSEKSKQCKTLEDEMEEKQKKCDKLEVQLKEILKENVRIAEENSQLQKKNEWIEKIENENAEIKMKLMQVTDDRNSAVKLTKGLQTKVENLEQVISNWKGIVERRQQLVFEHEEMVLVLQKKEEEIQQLQKIQAAIKRENEETVQLFEAQVKELETKYHNQTGHFNLLAQQLEELQNKKYGTMELELPHPTFNSTPIICPEKWKEDTCHSFYHDKNISDKDSISMDCGDLLPKVKALKSHSSQCDSTQNSSKTCPNPEGDAGSEMEELEADKVSINLELENPGPSKLRVFLARYSYDPFDGPNKNPEAELPLTAGEYVYICGEMDEDGFYEGELMDGRRGMVPSNLIEEVSGNDLISFVPSEANNISYHCYHEMGCPCQNSNCERKSESPDEDVCINLLSNRLGGELCEGQTAIPYPQNLSLIRQFAKSIIIGWDPPHMLDNCAEVHSYNIYVNTDLCCNVKHSCQMKATIENLDLKSKSYRISVQSVTDKGNSDKMQCTFLVGNNFCIAPTHLELQSFTATTAEITWLPSNSNYAHTVYLNEKEYDVTKAGIYWYTFQNLNPNSQYYVQVETQAPYEELFPQSHLKQKSRIITFTTLLPGPPNAPLDVQVQHSSSTECIIISWLPVTIDAVGSSNGVKVTGYAVYINGWKVTEVMSPTAGSISLAASQLVGFHGSCKVSVRTLSPYGESVDSVPALVPSALLNSPSSLLSKPVACTELFESEDEGIAMANSASSSLCSHLSMANADSNFTVHFTSNCKESDPYIPVNVSQNQEPFSTWTMSRNASHKDKGYSSLPSTVWKETSELVFPASACGESANFTQAPSHIFAGDTQKERLEEPLQSKNPTFKSQSDNKNISVYSATQYTNMIAGDSCSQNYAENSGACFWSPISSISPTQLPPKNGSYKHTGSYKICVQEKPRSFFERKYIKQMKELCRELSNLKVSTAETREEQVSRAESWQSPHVDNNHISDLLDIDREEEYRMDFSGKGNATLQEKLAPTEELTKDEIVTHSLTKSQTTFSVPNSNPQRSLILGEKVNNESERLFVALCDYDPVTMPTNSEAAGEELAFKEGQILKVTGDEDASGFYRGECEEKHGYIPCHMVSEIYIESKEVKEHLLKKSYLMDENV